MEMEKEVRILNLDDVLPNRFQPRIKFNEQNILELADSIREHGVIQPIVVRKIGDKYEIIAGERRYKASVLAGKTTIPAIITNLDDKNSAEIALIENVQRQDLTPIEEAISYKKILDMGYINQASLAEKLGKTQSTIANKLRLLNLDDEVQEALLEEKISERHARSLLKLNKDDQVKMLNRILTERMTVRKTDEEIMKILNHTESTDNGAQNVIQPQNDIEIIDFEEDQPEQKAETPSVGNQPINPGFMDIDKIEAQAKDIFVKPEIKIPEKPVEEEIQVQEPVTPVAPLEEVQEPTLINPVDINESVENTETVEQPQKPMVGRFFNMFNINREEENENYVSDVEQKEVNMDMSQPSFQSVPQFNPFAQPEQNQEVPSVEPQVQNESQVEMKAPEQPEGFITQPNFGNPTPVTPVPPVEQPSVAPVQSEPEEFHTVNPYTLTDDAEFTNPVNSPVEMPLPESSFNPTISNVELEPVSPVTEENTKPIMDMRAVINTIRDCVSTIEGFGYTVDEEEMDLQDNYKVTITIDKK